MAERPDFPVAQGFPGIGAINGGKNFISGSKGILIYLNQALNVHFTE